MYLNTFYGDANDYIHVEEGLEENDDEYTSNDETDTLEIVHPSEEEGGLKVEYCTQDPSVKCNQMKPLHRERYESPQ